MIRSAEKESRCQRLLAELYRPLKDARGWLEDSNLEYLGEPPEKHRFALRAFTDNIVMGWPLRNSAGAALRRALEKVSWFQIDMATHGFFVRGAITVGEVFIDDIAVFGPALLDTYDAEREHAVMPRVILTARAAQAEQEYRATDPLSQYTLRDADNRLFVNYLEAATHNEQLMENLITQHRNQVTSKLEEFKADAKIWSKYRWVAEYHNSFCDRHPEYFGDKKIMW